MFPKSSTLDECHFFLPICKGFTRGGSCIFEELSNAFSGDLGGIYTGCIGVIDELTLRIQRPSVTKELPDPGGYYCKKDSFL